MNVNEQQLLDELNSVFPSFTCTLQDLRNPTEEFVTSFYSCWLAEFEVNISVIPQIQFSQMQNWNVSQYSDSYSSTIPKLNLLQAIRAFNVVPDFGILDIVSPTPRRTQSVIRAFYEFYQWCDVRIGSMMDMKKEKKISERKQCIASLLQERQSLQEQLNNIFIVIGQLQDAKKELDGEVIKCQKRASELKVEKDMLKTQSDEANQKIREKEAILHKIVKEETQISNKIKDYSNQIVNSPTLILSDLDTLKAKDKEMKTLSEQKRDLVESKMKAQKNLEEVLASAEEKIGQLDEVLKLIEHQRKLLQVVSDIEKNTNSCQEELKELKSSLTSLMSKKSNRQEESQALLLKWKNTKDQLTKSVEAAKSEMNNQLAAKSKMHIGLKEDAALEENISSILEKINVHVKNFEEDYQRLLDQDDACFGKLQSQALARSNKAKKEAEKRLNGKKKAKK